VTDVLKAPFPYFGGKSRIADLVWSRFGTPRNFVEPFAGSLAVLLARPDGWTGTETVNDYDAMIANFWRALQADPDGLAQHADWPVHENDLHARHAWLVGQKESLRGRLEGDPLYYDVQIAGWWVWGIACWIGGGFCSGVGPWRVVDGCLVKQGTAGQGVNRQLVHLGDAGQGVNRQLVHLGDAGQGVNRQRVHLGDAGQGLREWMRDLSIRLRYVRVCSGDWSRVCGPTPTVRQGLTAVFLDPPYADTAGRASDVYAEDNQSVAHAVRIWALEHGDDPKMRIALCGYDGEHVMPETWECVAWKAHGGYGGQGKKVDTGRINSQRERIWFSPHCLHPSNGDASAVGDDDAGPSLDLGSPDD
jgi:DNA adenine methylase